MYLCFYLWGVQHRSHPQFPKDADTKCCAPAIWQEIEKLNKRKKQWKKLRECVVWLQIQSGRKQNM